jgi:hypothetical protein
MENSKKIAPYFIIFVIVLVITLALFSYPDLLNWKQFFGQNNSQQTSSEQERKFSESTFLAEGNGIEIEAPKNSTENIQAKSENYKIKQINFGGSALLDSGESEELSVVINNLQSEALLSGDNKEAKLLISWETNKGVISSVEYSRSDGQNPKKSIEDKYNTTHRLILSGLDPGVVYIYRITSRDRWGKEFISEYYSVFSGSPAVSVFDLISKSMNELFGWAIKK